MWFVLAFMISPILLRFFKIDIKGSTTITKCRTSRRILISARTRVSKQLPRNDSRVNSQQGQQEQISKDVQWPCVHRLHSVFLSHCGDTFLISVSRRTFATGMKVPCNINIYVHVTNRTDHLQIIYRSFPLHHLLL